MTIEIAKLQHMLKLEAAASSWWNDMSPRERKAYIKAHPKSKYGRMLGGGLAAKHDGLADWHLLQAKKFKGVDKGKHSFHAGAHKKHQEAANHFKAAQQHLMSGDTESARKSWKLGKAAASNARSWTTAANREAREAKKMAQAPAKRGGRRPSPAKPGKTTDATKPAKTSFPKGAFTKGETRDRPVDLDDAARESGKLAARHSKAADWHDRASRQGNDRRRIKDHDTMGNTHQDAAGHFQKAADHYKNGRADEGDASLKRGYSYADKADAYASRNSVPRLGF